MLQWIEKWIGGGPGGKKRITTFRWLLLIGLVGVALMIFNSFVTVKPVQPAENSVQQSPSPNKEAFLGGNQTGNDPFHDYELAYESALKDILDKIVGVGQAEVLVTIDSTEEVVVQQNEKDQQQITDEKDQSGATRHVTEVTRSGEVVLYENSGQQSPIVLKKIKPKIRGVVIVARGAENLTVKQLIKDAVEKGLGVPSYRISVLPSKQ